MGHEHEPERVERSEAARAADAELVARARTGDRLALAEIYRTHRKAVGQHLCMLTQDRATVDDLVQDTFVLAFGQLERFTGRSQLSTWLHGICINIARNHRRKHSRRRGILERVFGAQTEHEPRREAADETVREQAAMNALRDALDELPTAQREAFTLRVLEQLSLAEAAEVLQCPIATVSYRTRQAESRVRAYLDARGVTA